jgi:hypothetical protein
VGVNLEYPGYSTVVMPEALKAREAMPPYLQSKLAVIIDQLALNPKALENWSKKIGKNTYLYEHPDSSFQITYRLNEDHDPKDITFIHFAAPKFVVKRTLFISYSHEDAKWLERLRKFLVHLEDEDISIWDDRKLNAGVQWQDEIQKALTDARAAVLLISQDFLNSKFIKTEELPTLLEKAKSEGLLIFWVPVRPSTVLIDENPIVKFQAAVEKPEVALSKLRKPEWEEQLTFIRQKIGAALGLA